MRNLPSIFAVTLLALGAAACGGAGGDFADRFSMACSESTNWPDSLCACMAERAEEELSEDGRTFLLATLEEDEATVSQIRADLDMEEAMEAGLFMTKVESCAQYLEGAG